VIYSAVIVTGATCRPVLRLPSAESARPIKINAW
jgi:hypothetical protein